MVYRVVEEEEDQGVLMVSVEIRVGGWGSGRASGSR